MTPLTSAAVSLMPAARNRPEAIYEREIDAPESRLIEAPDFASGQTTVLAPGQKAGDQDEKGKRFNREPIGDRVVMPAHDFRIVEQMPVSDDVEHAHRAHDIDRYLARRRRGMLSQPPRHSRCAVPQFHPNHHRHCYYDELEKVTYGPGDEQARNREQQSRRHRHCTKFQKAPLLPDVPAAAWTAKGSLPANP